MKKLLLILLSLLLLALSACSNPSYANDVPLDTLATTIEESVATKRDYTTADHGALDDYFQTPDYVTDSRIRFSTEAKNLDEYGIFHVTDGNAAAMARLLQDYLDRSYEENRTWYDSYMPEETPKLRDAEVRVFGNYVVYAVYSAADKDALFNALHEALLQK